MKKLFLALLVLILLNSCDQKKTTEKKEDSKSEIKAIEKPSENESSKSELIDPDPDDGVPPERYSPHNSNIEVANKIKTFLTTDLLKDDLKIMEKSQRKFQYGEVDLNGNGEKEYLIGFKNSYFCGSGGCTYYLLNNDGSVITIFTVSDAPFIAMVVSKTNGWKDLLVKSDGFLRHLKYNGKTYPPNPSVAPKFTKIPSDDAYRLLWDEFPIPTFNF